MDREKTNSITELVKIVAREVFVEENKKTRALAYEATKNFCNDLKAEINKAGASWTEDEECALRKEVAVALEIIAKKHGRSYGAIKSRLSHQGFFREIDP